MKGRVQMVTENEPLKDRYNSFNFAAQNSRGRIGAIIHHGQWATSASLAFHALTSGIIGGGTSSRCLLERDISWPLLLTALIGWMGGTVLKCLALSPVEFSDLANELGLILFRRGTFRGNASTISP